MYARQVVGGSPLDCWPPRLQPRLLCRSRQLLAPESSEHGVFLGVFSNLPVLDDDLPEILLNAAKW